MQSLANKVIVIVGGTTGLGLSAAHACVNAGASVVIVGRDPANAQAAVAALGQNADLLIGDASIPQTAESAIGKAVERFGALHGLYHVAGGSGRRFGDGPLHEITDEGWADTLHLNLDSLFYSNRAAIRQFLRQGTGGSILNIGSVLGFSPSPKYFSTHAYATSKAAAIGLTRAAAAHYASNNIRVNLLAPALVETPMSRRAQENEAIMRFIATKQPLDGGRIGEASDLDAAVVYFLSDESRYTTGQVLAVDGGWCVSDGQHPQEAP
jgi:NAD(P)-dependent dehydrogenase (short-subunit alcohol dehydrogenase family)